MEFRNDCTEIKSSYCEERNERLYKSRQEFWKEGYKCYLKNEKWYYNFEHELSVGDCEQSFLSQMIFGHLLELRGYNGFFLNRYFMYVYGRDDKKTLFHFDVMNNPKDCHELGRIAKKKCE